MVIDTLDDLEILFSNILQDKVSVSITSDTTAPVVLTIYAALAAK